LSRPLRVALVAEDYYPQLGGVPEHVHNIALELERRGHAPTVVTSHMRGHHIDAPFVRRVGQSIVIYANSGVSRITAGWRLTDRLARLFRDGRFDLVHVHGGLAPTFGLLAPIAAERVGLPVIATFHSWFPRSAGYRVLRKPLQRLLDRHTRLIAVSTPVVDALRRYFRGDWEIIPNGVDLAAFHPNGREPLEARAGRPELLFLARLEPRNGLGTVLDAMPRILARFPGARLTVAGDGPWRGYYERRARTLGDRVVFLGRVFADRPAHYDRADLYLCPTTRASFGVTLLEAMACGTPLVLADNVGFRSVVRDGHEAAMVPGGHAAAWAETTIALLEDPARRAAMSRAGLATVARFSWPEIAERTLALYEDVLR
jgi:phosphatidylinositol alpha-mannosyltransferase